MSDEAIVEVMAERLIATLGVGARKPHAYAADLLATLRSEGWELFHRSEAYDIDLADRGDFWLVPVPAESEEGNG